MREPYDRSGFISGAERPEHYEAIGRLVSSFSQIEVTTMFVFAHVFGIKFEIVRAVWGGSRWLDMVTQLRAMIVWRPIHDKDMLLGALDDAAKVKKVRDIVAHFVWQHRGDEMLFTNGFAAKSREGIQEHIFTTGYLKSLVAFQDSITTRLTESTFPQDDNDWPSDWPEEFIKGFQDRKKEALLAKFPEPANPGGNVFPKPKKQKPPRKAFPQKSQELE